MRQKTYLFAWELADSTGVIDSMTNYSSLLDTMLKIILDKNDG